MHYFIVFIQLKYVNVIPNNYKRFELSMLHQTDNHTGIANLLSFFEHGYKNIRFFNTAKGTLLNQGEIFEQPPIRVYCFVAIGNEWRLTHRYWNHSVCWRTAFVTRTKRLFWRNGCALSAPSRMQSNCKYLLAYEIYRHCYAREGFQPD